MKLGELLKVSIPVVQAPMAGVQNWRLAAAVTEAGGLGSIPCGMLTPAQVVNEIEQFRRASSGSFNLNFFCHAMPHLAESALATWRARLQPYYEELQIDEDAAAGASRMPFSQEMADALSDYAPPVMSFHFGLPAPDLLKQVKSWGSVVLSSATTLEEGVWLQAHGADAVIAQGVQAGGHRGMFLTADLASQRDTTALVRDLVGALDVPVIAAGGIAHSEDVTALLEQGAQGVQVGTSYLLCPEADTSYLHRQALCDPNSQTALTNVFSGRPARGIRNRLMRDLGSLCADAPAFPHAATALVPLRKEAERRGSSDFTPLWSGDNRVGCQELPAAELTRRLWPQGL